MGFRTVPIPTPFVVYFLGLKQPDFADAASLTEITCFPTHPSRWQSCVTYDFGGFCGLWLTMFLVCLLIHAETAQNVGGQAALRNGR